MDRPIKWTARRFSWYVIILPLYVSADHPFTRKLCSRDLRDSSCSDSSSAVYCCDRVDMALASRYKYGIINEE